MFWKDVRGWSPFCYLCAIDSIAHEKLECDTQPSKRRQNLYRPLPDRPQTVVLGTGVAAALEVYLGVAADACRMALFFVPIPCWSS